MPWYGYFHCGSSQKLGRIFVHTRFRICLTWVLAFMHWIEKGFSFSLVCNFRNHFFLGILSFALFSVALSILSASWALFGGLGLSKPSKSLCLSMFCNLTLRSGPANLLFSSNSLSPWYCSDCISKRYKSLMAHIVNPVDVFNFAFRIAPSSLG